MFLFVDGVMASTLLGPIDVIRGPKTSQYFKNVPGAFGEALLDLGVNKTVHQMDQITWKHMHSSQ